MMAEEPATPPPTLGTLPPELLSGIADQLSSFQICALDTAKTSMPTLDTGASQQVWEKVMIKSLVHGGARADLVRGAGPALYRAALMLGHQVAHLQIIRGQSP